MKKVDDKVYAYEANSEVMRWVPESARTALDLGCGAGGNARELAKRGCQVDGVTLSPEEAGLAKEVCHQVFVQNLEQGLPPEVASRYDLILASHVLEHICFPEKLLADVRVRMDERSRLIVALPNLLYWRNRCALLAGNFDYCDGGLMDNTHFRWYTFKTAADMLRQNGFKVEHAYATGWIPQPMLRSVLPKVAGRIDKAASARFPGLFGFQMVFVASKSGD